MGNQPTPAEKVTEEKATLISNEPVEITVDKDLTEIKTEVTVNLPPNGQSTNVEVNLAPKEEEGFWSIISSVSRKADELKAAAAKEIAATSLFNLETKQSIGELYKLLEEYGQDISLSDLFVGYLMLTSHYKYTHPYNQNYVSYEEMEDGAYYMKFSNAVYGWKLIDGILKSDIGNVLSGFTKKLSTSDDSEIAHNISSYIKYTELSADTIVSANWFSSYMKPAHLVCVSEEKKRIIISIRGTMDAHDCLSDVICIYENMEVGQCHKGMSQCAKNKLAVIEQPLLETLEKYPGYGVAVTGHSLGAGTAGILIYLLKKKYPELDIIGRLYGCPPIFDIETARAFSPCVTCFVNRDDIIPRLTYGSLYDLKAMIKAVLADNPQSSQRIWQVVSAGGSLPKFIKDKMNESVVQAGYDIQKLKALKVSEKIFQPGKVIYIYQPKEVHSYSAWYGEVADQLLFDEIILSSHMYTDHLPWAYEENLKHCIEKHKNIQIKVNVKVDGENVPLGSVEVDVNRETSKVEIEGVRLVSEGEGPKVEIGGVRLVGGVEDPKVEIEGVRLVGGVEDPKVEVEGVGVDVKSDYQ